MRYKKDKHSLHVTLRGDFNLNAVHQIKDLFQDRDSLTVDLSMAHFVNSESIIYLHRLLDSGKKIRLKNPPKQFYEALHILKLHTVWDLKTIVEP